jgi:hypothetical protein
LEIAVDKASLDFYEKNGFLKMPGLLFSPEDFQKLSHYVLATTNRIVPEKSGLLRNVWKAEPELIEFACHDAIVNSIKPVLGPNIGAFSACIIKKKAKTPHEFGWHSDVSDFDQFAMGLKGLSVTVSLTDCTKESGCVEYAPGSHLIKRWDARHNPNLVSLDYHPDLTEEEVKKLSPPVAIELKPNEFSIADISIIHKSAPNKTDADRINIVFRYFSTSALNDFPSEACNFWKDKYTFLVAGQDQLGICRFRLVV